MRIRTIKPEFFKHDGLAELPPLSRLFFIGLWCVADRDGRLEDRPARLKIEILPYDKGDADEILSELAKRGFIQRYTADGLQVIQVVAFKRHQRISGKESEIPSRFPEYNGEAPGKHPGSNGEAPGSPGREGKGKEGNEEGKGMEYHPDCRIALHWLNEKAGRHYRETDDNLATISARLREPDVTIDGVKKMIDRMASKWKGDEKMAEFLRPATLFGKQKFDGYYGAKDVPLTVANPNGWEKNNCSPPIQPKMLSFE